jgi:hypothetical protein
VISSSGSDDDLIGGFRHGGWHLPYFDEIAVQWVVEGYQAAGGFLFGRRTYALLVGYCGSGAHRRRAARVRRTHGMNCSTDRAMTDEIGAAVRSYRTTTKPTRRDL